jgi:hypothetical protein
MIKKISGLSAIMASLLLLSSCDWFKPKPVIERETATKGQKNDMSTQAATGEVLLTIDGKPAIMTSQFEDYKNTIMEAQPQLKQMAAFIPDLEEKLFESMEHEIALQHWLNQNNIAQEADYQKDRRMGIEFLDRQLAIKYFQDRYPKMNKIEVSDAEAKKMYDDRKESTPELTISRGGINGKLVEFKKEEDAKAFLEKVKESNNFAQAAKDQKVKIKELKQITVQSFDVEGPVREKLLEVKSFPALELIKGKDAFFVVQALNKEEAKYVPFEQVKDPIKQQLKTQKLFGEELEKVKKGMNVKRNEAYFERLKQEREKEMEKMKEEAQKHMEQAQKQKKADAKSEKKSVSAHPTKPTVQGA